jgi:menaquinone-dependent protoporphyrinogen IX oxidase
MKLISARTGRPTDTSRDWEFTNWQEIDEFAATVGKLVRPDKAVRPEVTEVS